MKSLKQKIVVIILIFVIMSFMINSTYANMNERGRFQKVHLTNELFGTVPFRSFKFYYILHKRYIIYNKMLEKK